MAEVNRLTQGTWARLSNISNSRLKKGIAIGTPAAVYSLIDRIGSDWVHMPLTMLVGAIIVTAISSLTVWAVSNRSRRIMSEVKVVECETELKQLADQGLDLKRLRYLEEQYPRLVSQNTDLQAKFLDVDGKWRSLKSSGVIDELDVYTGDAEGSVPKHQIFALGDFIGEGGMGVIRKAKIPSAQGKQIEVVIKRIRPEDKMNKADIEHLKARLLREGKKLLNPKLAGHKNFPAIYGFGFDEDGMPFIIMEYIKGIELAKRIRKPGNKGINPEMAIDYAIELAGALYDLHQAGIIHRDMKPENVLIERKIDSVEGITVKKDLLKIIDLGLAKAVPGTEETRLTQTNVGPMGTLVYMSPEQTGQGEWKVDEVDHRTDIYSLGIMFCEMLTGKPLHSVKENENPMIYLYRLIKEVWPLRDRIDIASILDEIDLPNIIKKDFERIIRKATHPDRDKRYRNAKEFKDDLLRLKDKYQEARWNESTVNRGM